MSWERRIRPIGSGRYELALDDRDRQGLKELGAWLRNRLVADTTAPAVRRLFPPAYEKDEEREIEYQELMRDELLERRLEHLDVLEETADAAELDDEQIEAWMAAINEIRLVLGTELDITEDEDPLDAAADAPDAGLRLDRGGRRLAGAVAQLLPPGSHGVARRFSSRAASIAPTSASIDA
jgi:hypothetical protein